ncbi:MAG: hypothetical protein ABIK53_08015 [bacterium]
MFTRQKLLIIAITLMFISSFAIPVMARDRSQSSGRSETQRTEERTERRTERKSRTERTERIERTERKERMEQRERRKREDTERREKSVEKTRVEHKSRLRPEEIKFRRSSEKVQMATKRTFLSPWSRKVTGTRLGSFDISREEEVSIIIWSNPLPTKLAKRSSSQTEPVSIIIHMKPKEKNMRATYLDSAVLPSGETVSIIIWSEPLPKRIEKKLESSIIFEEKMSSFHAQSDLIATSQKLLVQMMEEFAQVVETLISTTEGAMNTQGRVMRHVVEGEEEISATYLGSVALPNGEAISIIIFVKPLPTELRGESNPQPSPSPVTLKRYCIPPDCTDAEKREVEKKVDATHLVSSVLPSGETVSIVIQEEPLPTRVVEESILERLLAQIVMDSETIEKFLDESGRIKGFSYMDKVGKKHDVNNIEYDKYGRLKSYTETTYNNEAPDKITTKTHEYKYDELGRAAETKVTTHSYGIVFDADKLKKLSESLEVDTDEFKEFFESLGGNTDKFKELLKTMDVDTDELKELMRNIDYNKLAQAISEDTHSSEILSLFFRHKTITTVRMNTEYDEMGRVEKNTEITYSSETPGLITTTTERHKYDELGRVTETKVTTHSYGINLDGESIEDIEYDDFGRMIGYSYTDQDGDTHEVNNIMHDKTTTRTHIFTYNSSGQLEREIVYNHQTGELSDVDALKEMLSKMDADEIKEFLGSFDEGTKELLIKFLKDHKILISDDNGDDKKDEEEEQ